MQPVGILAAVLALCLYAGGCYATVFAFSWSGGPATDATIISSTDATLRASGIIEIDAAAGSVFTFADIIRTDIAVTGDSIDDFMFSTWVEAGGSVSADGSRAFFSAAGNPFSQETVAKFFGCRSPACDFNFAIDVSRTEPVTPIAQVVYGSAADALASMRLRAIALPEPASGAILLLGFIALLTTRFGQSKVRTRTR